MNEVKHVAIYLRISVEKKQENVETLDNHKQILTSYAKEQGWTYKIYGEVLSGGASDLNKRPELQRLLQDIEKFDAILVIELSRLSRNGLISETVLQYCVDYDRPIFTPHAEYDLANDNNAVLMFRFGSLIASQEHSLIGKRSKANKKTMVRQGLHVSGGIPYGYRRNKDTKKLEIYEEEAKAVRLIFKLHSLGLGSRRIVDKLNAEGYTPQRSDAWNLPSVKRIIRNPTYKGTIFFNDRKRIKEAGKYTYKILDTIVVDNAHPAIIDPKDWERANKERAERAEHFKVREKPSNTFHTILKDLCFCGKCGRKSVFRKDRNGKTSIKPCEFLLPNSASKCGNCGMLSEYLEQEVILKIKNYRNELHEELQKLNEFDFSGVEQELQTRKKHTEIQLKAVEQQQKNLIDLAVRGIFNVDELKDKKQELINQEEEMKSLLKELKEQLAHMDTKSFVDKVQGIIDLLDNFETLTIEEQNNVLKRVIKRINFKRDIPPELRKLSTRNPERRNYPFEYEIEYFD